MNKVLLVEDDRYIREAVTDYFSDKASGDIELFSAPDGDRAEEMLYEQEFDLVLLDVMLPGIDGFSLCRNIRRNSEVPVIFLTARAGEGDVLYGYETGCDDYIVKPFSIAQLLAKVRAMLKRSKGMVCSREIVCGKICLEPYSYQVKVNGEPVPLPPKEYAILKYFMERQNVLVSREQLLMNLWGYEFDGNDRVVDNHIKKLRKRLGTAGGQIKTIISKGYRLTEDA